MKKIIYYISFILLSCNNNQETKDNHLFFEGKELYDNKCSSCHSYLTFERMNQTSLSQMRELKFENLYAKIKSIMNDSNHVNPPLNINYLTDSDIKKIVYYINKTAEPTP